MDGSANEVVEGGDLLLDVKLVLYKLLKVDYFSKTFNNISM